MRKVFPVIILVTAVLLLARQLFGKTAGQKDNQTSRQLGSLAPQTIATNLEIPWEMVFLPDGRMFVTERPGRVLLISDQKKNYED